VRDGAAQAFYLAHTVPHTLSDNVPEALRTVHTRPLFAMRLDTKMQVVGAAPDGFRRVGVLPGGVFEGERLSGKVLEGGSDWQTVRADGAITLDVRLVLETTEGDLVAMVYRGLRHGSAEVSARLDRGEDVDPASYYFRMTARFETAAAKYDWLNRVIAIGVGHRRADGPLYNVHELL